MIVPCVLLKASMLLFPGGIVAYNARLSSGVSFLVRLFAVVVVAISLSVLILVAKVQLICENNEVLRKKNRKLAEIVGKVLAFLQAAEPSGQVSAGFLPDFDLKGIRLCTCDYRTPQNGEQTLPNVSVLLSAQTYDG